MTGGLSSTLAALARANAAQRPMTRVSFEMNRVIGMGDRDEWSEEARVGSGGGGEEGGVRRTDQMIE